MTDRYLLLGLVASILPDVDILYFYLVDHRQTLHHSYWIHIPFYWLMPAAAIFLALWLFKKKDYLMAALIFFGNILLHLVLDTIVGKIEWLYPFADKAYYLFDVPAVHDFWLYNFIFHWTFLFEIGVTVWAIILFIRQHQPYGTLRYRGQ
jgi:inner membrane protein